MIIALILEREVDLQTPILEFQKSLGIALSIIDRMMIVLGLSKVLETGGTVFDKAIVDATKILGTIAKRIAAQELVEVVAGPHEVEAVVIGNQSGSAHVVLLDKGF
jgi:hypothetical protein